MPRRLLTLSHSYVVALNRRLAVELARVGGRDWEVTAAAPRFFHGDLRPITLEPDPGSDLQVLGITAHATKLPHAFFYGRDLLTTLRRDYDVLHCWEEPYVFAAAEVARFTPARTKLVFATFQSLPKRYPPPFRQFERYAMERASGWIAWGSTVRTALADRPGYRERQCAEIPTGVDVEAFRPDAEAGARARAKLGWSEGGPPVVGFVGRFVPEKGGEHLARALDRVTEGWRALLVGNGRSRPALEAWARPYGDRVRIVTDATHDQVPSYLNAIDVLCVPSQTTPRWKEQFGRILIEAFACGRAVLASDSGEIPHTVGNAAVVVAESDVSGWANALSSLLTQPQRRQELGALGRERALSRFAWSVVARQHLDFFERLPPR